MSGKSRRDFLKSTALIGAGVTGLTTTAKAGPQNILSEDRMGVLVDTTVCVGCRNCEWACKDAHNLPAGNLEDYEDRKVLDTKRRPGTDALTVVNEYSHGKNSSLPIDVKSAMYALRSSCLCFCLHRWRIYQTRKWNSYVGY